MSIWMFLKVFSDLCVIFALLGAFPQVIVYHSSLMLPAILCAFGAGVAAGLQNSGRDHLRWLGAVFPALALYLARTTGEFAIVLPAAAYTTLVILRGQLQLEYYSFRHSFRNSLRIVGIWYVLLCIFAFLEETPVQNAALIREEAVLRFGLIHCCAGILLQRQLRLGGDTVAKGSYLQLAGMIVGTGSVVAAFLTAMPVLRKGLAAVFQAALFAAMSLAAAVYESFVEVDYVGMNKALEEARADSEVMSVAPNWAEIIPQQPQVAEKEPSYWWLILVAAAAVAAAILMLRSFGKKRVRISTEETVQRIDTPERPQKDARRTNRGKVRHCYREYLRYEQKRGLRLQRYDTSGDVLEKSAAASDKTAAAALRQIYLQARYDETGEITRDQAETAKALLKKIRSGENAV